MILFTLGITQINLVSALAYYKIRSLATQEVALQINTDFTPSELLFHTEVFFCFSQKFFSLTECTDITEFTLRVPSGFEFSPTDYTD